MRQKMRVTRTISTSVEEKDWKSCCPTCVMQVPLLPPPAPWPRALALPLPLALGEAKVRLRRHGGSASLSSLAALALIGAGLGGAGPSRLPLLSTRFSPAKKRTEPAAPKTTPWRGRGCARERRTKGATVGKQTGQGASGAQEILSGPASNACPRALFLCQSTRLQREQAWLGSRPLPGEQRTGMISATAKRPSERTASAGRCQSSQPTDPSPPARPWPRTKAFSSALSPLCGEEGLRRHRGDADYSADKAASLRPPQLSNCNRHAATSERGPRFSERRFASFLRPLNGCLLLNLTLPSTHPGPPSRLRERNPPLGPPPSRPSLNDVRSLRYHSHGGNPGATSHSTPVRGHG